MLTPPRNLVNLLLLYGFLLANICLFYNKLILGLLLLFFCLYLYFLKNPKISILLLLNATSFVGLVLPPYFSVLAFTLSIVLIGMFFGYKYVVPAVFVAAMLFLYRTANNVAASFVSIFLFVVGSLSFVYHREVAKFQQRLTLQNTQLTANLAHKSVLLEKYYLDKLFVVNKFADLGKAIGAVIHDTAGPLTTLSLTMGQYGTTTVDLAKAYVATKKLVRITKTIQNLLASVPTKESFDVTTQLDDALLFLNHAIKSEHILIKRTVHADLILSGNPIKFFRVIKNLLANAIDAYKNIPISVNKIIEVIIKLHSDSLVLIVKDYGCGIYKSRLTKIFDPFFTTKGYGAGLGLYICKNIIEKDYGGSIAVESTIGVGTQFTITIPV